MASIPELTESIIKQWVEEQSFERGQEYYEQGAIIFARRTGLILKAQCRGSYENSYSVTVDLKPSGIKGAWCSCPVEKEGRCKHVVALLLTWLHHSEQFLVLEPIEKLIESKTREELIALLKDMVQKFPELELILDPSIKMHELGMTVTVGPEPEWE